MSSKCYKVYKNGLPRRGLKIINEYISTLLPTVKPEIFEKCDIVQIVQNVVTPLDNFDQKYFLQKH